MRRDTRLLNNNLRRQYSNKWCVQAHITCTSSEIGVLVKDNISAELNIEQLELPHFDEYEQSTYDATVLNVFLTKIANGLDNMFAGNDSMHLTVETTKVLAETLSNHLNKLKQDASKDDMPLVHALSIKNPSCFSLDLDDCKFKIAIGKLSVTCHGALLELPCPVMTCEIYDDTTYTTRFIEILALRPKARHVFLSKLVDASTKTVYITPQKCRLLFGTHLGSRVATTHALSESTVHEYHEEHVKNFTSLFGWQSFYNPEIFQMLPVIVCTSHMKSTEHSCMLHTVFFELDHHDGFLFQ